MHRFETKGFEQKGRTNQNIENIGSLTFPTKIYHFTLS